MIAELAIGTVLAGAYAHGTFHRNSPVFGKVITRLPEDDKMVSLTFDDGPNPVATPLILDHLARENVKATFFFLGRHVERWPHIVKRAAEEGHQIGNHGYFHRKLHLKSPTYVRKDISRGTQAIKIACGIAPLLFRAPHGFRSPWVNGIARQYGQQVVGWSLGVWDSDKPGVDEIAQRAIAGIHPGGILLLHDGDGYDPDGDRTQTAAALPIIIGSLKETGYRFRTLPQ